MSVDKCPADRYTFVWYHERSYYLQKGGIPVSGLQVVIIVPSALVTDFIAGSCL